MDKFDYNGREARIIEAVKAGAKPDPGVAAELVRAKLALQRNVLADSYGGLLGPDSLGQQTNEAGERYERALTALEEDLGLEAATR